MACPRCLQKELALAPLANFLDVRPDVLREAQLGALIGRGKEL